MRGNREAMPRDVGPLAVSVFFYSRDDVVHPNVSFPFVTVVNDEGTLAHLDV